MASLNFLILLYSLSIPFCILFPQTNSLTFNLTNFNDQYQKVNITTFGDAYISPEGLQVTSDELNTNLQDQVGKATYIEPLLLWDNSTGNLTDFSTHFVFMIDSNGEDTFADGLAFFLAPEGSNFTPGGAIGLPINYRPTTSGAILQPTSPFVAVEFDTYGNVDFCDGWDPVTIGQHPHVGIDVNSLKSNVTDFWYGNITHGIENEVWIRYNSSSYNLSVVFTTNDHPRVTGSIHFIVDLRKYLPEWVTVGFSAATGMWFEKNLVTSWEFSSTLEISLTNTTVPSTGNKNNTVPSTGNNTVPNPGKPTDPVKPGSKKISLESVVGLVVGLGVLVGGFVLVGFSLWRRSRAKEEDEFEVEMSMESEFESGSGPKKFSHGQLSRATNNFDEKQKLGQGGFGGVYKGFLRESNSYIAVKRISKGSEQGIKEYAAEVKIISRLRHRNLVQLIGWCHEKKELLLVYEFMENTSLDFHLFKGKSMLTWVTRYRIAQGLAFALLYLHEEWEQCVVHRDIKSSNVMLDSNFNAKLGDFGLARLVDHEKEPQTTALAGTMGYLALEYVVTGKATKESDVYSFGVVALEIACGRKPFDMKVPECQIGMVEWVWDLYGMGRLLEAADPILRSDFNEREMEQLMIVGLWCAHPDHKSRPKIRQVIQVLNFEALLPILPKKLPALSCFPPPSITDFLKSISSSSALSSSNEILELIKSKGAFGAKFF